MLCARGWVWIFREVLYVLSCVSGLRNICNIWAVRSCIWEAASESLAFLVTGGSLKKYSIGFLLDACRYRVMYMIITLQSFDIFYCRY